MAPRGEKLCALGPSPGLKTRRAEERAVNRTEKVDCHRKKDFWPDKGLGNFPLKGKKKNRNVAGFRWPPTKVG